jgi:hypothetical protein
MQLGQLVSFEARILVNYLWVCTRSQTERIMRDSLIARRNNEGKTTAKASKKRMHKEPAGCTCDIKK